MSEKENKSDSGVKNIPRNPNRKITDQEIDQILKSAAEQIAEKENKVSDKKSSGKQERRTAEAKKREEEQKAAAKKREDEKKHEERNKRDEDLKNDASKKE